MSAETFRDEWGIPHLRADNAEELAFLQGFNAATDRSWQIEMERWRSEGRTAEQLGADGLEWDRFARRSRLDDTARRCFTSLDAATRGWCSAYVDGVNHALGSGVRDAPEFRDTDTAPAPWEPWTPLGVFLVHHILFGTFPNKLWRAHVTQTLGAGAVDLFSIEAPVWAGSNAWAAAGSMTQSGYPLIAGDPHRLMELPGVYQQVRLACPEFDVVGLAFPGVPGIPHFGHTGTVAWAVTNAMADYQDLYSEQLRREGHVVLALGPDGARPVLAQHEETILVRGSAAETVEVIETERGPVISGGVDGGALSLRTPARVAGTLGFEALLPLLRSRSAADVETALEAWVEPVNCVLVADSDGGTRQLIAGKVPVRSRENRVRPVPAWSTEHQWTGGWEDLPRTPVSALAVNANDRDSGGGDRLGLEFAPAHRARRIRQLLEEGGTGLDTAYMERIHMDSLLGSWPVFRALLQGLTSRPETDPLSGTATLSETALAFRARLLEWDGHMHAESGDAAAFAAWRSALVLALAGSPALNRPGAAHSYAPLFAPWLNPVARVGFALETILAKGPSYGIDVMESASRALEETAAAAPSGTWGASHTVLPLHALADHGTGGAASVPAVPLTQLSGDTACVLSTESLPGLTDRSFRGPVARYVWDLENRANSRWVVPFGASGLPENPHFASQLPVWAAGDLIPVITDWEQLTKENHDPR
ncbi:penicillin acylase family protein [Arthrobacter oryzae]|jgi:penicillin amidase|uniref:penicillin acylase family protein n=1 Tax=Arthrobacter oryzae TaxID=409290 RepID=UPI00278616A6|nr:penicillin acylase family protein [Arthrobacter oryzae]MDQ0078006.1 penicillin amidase [Arthrobacter oryzae]